MYEITFWTFSKKENSTAFPSTTGTKYNCELMNESGFVNPVIILDLGAAVNPTVYTYAYINDFSRYYFIKDWQYSTGLWICNLAVDALASFKTQIGSLSTYIHVSEYDTSKRFPDNRYAHATTPTIQNTMVSGPFTGSITSGCYIVGIIGTAYNDSPVTNYYVFDSAAMQLFVNKLFDSASWLNITDITEDLQKALFNPIQYIISCMWFPFSYSSISSKNNATKVVMGWWEFTGFQNTNTYRLAGAPHVELATTITIPKHPDSGTRGEFMNLAPHSNYFLQFWPYGQFNLDTTQLVNFQSLQLAQTIDLIDGRGFLEVSGYADGTATHFCGYYAQIGVPIALAQANTNIMGTLINGAISTVGSIASGNIIGAAKGLTDGVIDAVVPNVQITGTNGGYNTYNINIILTAQFFRPAQAAANVFGNVSNTVGTISSYPGYLEVEPGPLSLSCTEQERAIISATLKSGFYYE